jgi:hypothetical protein
MLTTFLDTPFISQIQPIVAQTASTIIVEEQIELFHLEFGLKLISILLGMMLDITILFTILNRWL